MVNNTRTYIAVPDSAKVDFAGPDSAVPDSAGQHLKLKTRFYRKACFMTVEDQNLVRMFAHHYRQLSLQAPLGNIVLAPLPLHLANLTTTLKERQVVHSVETRNWVKPMLQYTYLGSN